MNRPKFEDIESGEEFNNWYWLKAEMVEMCKKAGIPSVGRKFDLRDRIMYALDHNGAVKPATNKSKPKSKFNWAKAELTLETKITDNISFGRNLRQFMKEQIGNSFAFNSDFMDWAKANSGQTLRDAVEQYRQLEKRKDDPNFKRKIAANNMFNQYTRDFLKDNPDENLKTVRKYWLLKKNCPTKNGFVRYERSDLELTET